MLKIASISKWNSKKAEWYATLKEGDVLWAYRIGKKEDYFSNLAKEFSYERIYS
jgi:hypothetical protein